MVSAYHNLHIEDNHQVTVLGLEDEWILKCRDQNKTIVTNIFASLNTNDGYTTTHTHQHINKC